MDDLFGKWLNNKESKLIKIALTDKSYKNYFQRKNKTEYSDEINNDLSTLGDAVISLCYIDLLYGSCKELSEERKKYVTDKVLVSVIAKYYGLVRKIKKDDNDSNMPKDYEYVDDKLIVYSYLLSIRDSYDKNYEMGIYSDSKATLKIDDLNLFVHIR